MFKFTFWKKRRNLKKIKFMETNYKIEFVKSKRRLSKQYFWRVKSSNGQIILTSETYKNKTFAIKISQNFATALNCLWVDLT